MSDVPPPPPPPPPDNLNPPPGYVGYGTAPTPLARIHPVRGISKGVAILVGIVGVLSAVGGLVAPLAADRAGDFLAGRASADEFREAYTPLALVQLLVFAGTIAAGVVTIVWMYRISANVRAFGRPTVWAPLFAVFGWILPPVFVVIPFLMLRELWKASTAEGINDPQAWKRQPENPLLWVWFALFGVVPTVLLIAQRGSMFEGGNLGNVTTESLAESIEDAGALSVATGGIQLVAAIVWILFVRQLTARHATLTAER